MISQPSWQANQKNATIDEWWKNAQDAATDSHRLVHDLLAVFGKNADDVSEDMYEQLMDFIFLFQGVMNRDFRREIGAHYCCQIDGTVSEIDNTSITHSGTAKNAQDSQKTQRPQKQRKLIKKLRVPSRSSW